MNGRDLEYCAQCGKALQPRPVASNRGLARRYCGNRCRVAAYRARQRAARAEG